MCSVHPFKFEFMRSHILLALLIGLAGTATPASATTPSPPAVCQRSAQPIKCYIQPDIADYSDSPTPVPSGASFDECITGISKAAPGVNHYTGLTQRECELFFSNATLVNRLESYTLCNTNLCNAPPSSSSASAVGAAAALGVAALAVLL